MKKIYQNPVITMTEIRIYGNLLDPSPVDVSNGEVGNNGNIGWAKPGTNNSGGSNTITIRDPWED